MNTTFKKIVSTLTLLIILFATQSVIAQKSTLKGVIKDDLSGETLIGATVVLLENNLSQVTDLDGLYRINSIPPGVYTIEIRYLGYITVQQQITLESGQELEQNIKLKYESVMADEVVISAQAEGQISSINQQLADNTIKNIVSAKKIQETPNANAAEAIGRVSGVSIVRSGGEGSKVVIRGLAPKFNKIQVEGVRMASTGGDDRSTNLSMISPYMLDGIEVSKAAMADQEGDVIGGTVNFILREAPEKPTFDAILQGGYSSLNKNFNNYKMVVGGSRRLFNNKLGVFAQIDLERRDRSSNDVGINYLNRTNQLDSFPLSLGAMSVRDVKRDIKRGGATVVLDYKLPSGSIKLSNFGSLINNTQKNRYELYNPFFSTHSYGLTETENDISVMTNALKLKNSFGAFSIEMGISYSQSNNKLPNNTDFFATEPNAFESQVSLANRPDSIQYYSRNKVENANIQRISKSLFDTNEKEIGADINLLYDLSLSSNLNIKFKTGVKYKKLTKEFSQESSRIPVAQAGHGAEFVKAAIEKFDWLNNTLESDASKLPYSLFIDEEYGTNTFPDGEYYIQNTANVDRFSEFSDLAESYYFKDHILSTKDNYNGTEEYSAAYFMPIINLGRSLTFIPGVRYENNKTNYTAVRGDNTLLDWDTGYFSHDTTINRAHAHILPMLHIKYKPTDWFDVRLAYTHTLARPNFNQIIPKWDIGISTITWNNPFLLPSLSKNYDIYLSAYKSKLGLFTIGGFYKNIDNLIYNAGNTVVKADDIEKHSLPENTIGSPISKIVNNATPAELFGLEIEWQTRFWYLDNFLSGMVLTANYTRTFSSVDYERTVLDKKFLQEPPWEILEEKSQPYNERLVFQPTDIFNLTIGYDYKDLATRLSFLYQNNIFSNPNFFRLLRGATDDYFRVDLSMTQKLPWKGFEALLNFSNLTSSKESDSLIASGTPTRIQHYGFTLDVGIRYRLK
ncbi:MAG: TonB-dependent receptor [Saprospiraceae bacterium]